MNLQPLALALFHLAERLPGRDPRIALRVSKRDMQVVLGAETMNGQQVGAEFKLTARQIRSGNLDMLAEAFERARNRLEKAIQERDSVIVIQ